VFARVRVRVGVGVRVRVRVTFSFNSFELCHCSAIVPLFLLIFLSYDLLIEGLARQWVAYSEGHSPESRRTCRVDTVPFAFGPHDDNPR
jgi:hypothetical protein